MTEKACKQCGATKPLTSFYSNGKNRDRRPTCIACERKTPDNSEDIRQAVAMWLGGKGVRKIAKHFGWSHNTLTYRLRKAGIDTASRRPNSRNTPLDTCANKPIGEAQSERWAKIDGAIMRARLEAGMIDGKRRIRANPWPTQSSLA